MPTSHVLSSSDLTEAALLQGSDDLLALRKYSSAFVLMPGGIGTLDEIFETGTLIQTGKLPPFPIVMMGCAYWQPVQQAIQKVMFEAGTFQEGEVDVMMTDSPAEAVAHITVQPVLSPQESEPQPGPAR